MPTKICVLGDPSVGKDSLVHRYTGLQSSPPSGDVLPAPTPFTLYANPDSAGATSIKSLCGEASGAFIVCDLTRPETIETARFYANLFRVAHPDAPVVFLANKADAAVPTPINSTELAHLAASFDAPWFACSTVTGSGIPDAFETMAGLLSHHIRFDVPER